MKVIAVCGSPRKNGNTEIILKEVLKGAQKEGAKTGLIQLAGKNIKYLGAVDVRHQQKLESPRDLRLARGARRVLQKLPKNLIKISARTTFCKRKFFI